LKALTFLASSKSKKKEVAEVRSERKERLVWRVYTSSKMEQLRVQPYLQKQSKTGWTRGRAIPWDKLFGDVKSFRDVLTAHDLRVLEGMKSLDYYIHGSRTDEIVKAIEELVGHPNVYAADSDEPVKII